MFACIVVLPSAEMYDDVTGMFSSTGRPASVMMTLKFERCTHRGFAY